MGFHKPLLRPAISGGVRDRGGRLTSHNNMNSLASGFLGIQLFLGGRFWDLNNIAPKVF